MAELENPFKDYAPKQNLTSPPEKAPTLDEIAEDAMALVTKISWCNNNPDGSPTYVQNRMVFAQATTMVGEMCDIENPESVRKCISAYFEMCRVNSTDPTLPGLANAIGKSTAWLKSIKDVATDGFFTRRPLQPEVKDAIYQALRVLDQMFAQAVYDGRITPGAATMLGQNHFDYLNKVEHKVDIASRVEAPKTPEEIQREFEELPPLDVEYEEVKE